MVALVDITGKRFGRWTVVGIGDSVKKKRLWQCVCECGTKAQVNGDSLRRGISKSCGCLSADNTRSRMTTHGMTSHPMFGVWKGMLDRCRNPNSKSYRDYGSRGIDVCERWEDFESFYGDMSEGYMPGMTIDRIDNSNGYQPGNCRWIPRSEQNKNRRSTIYVDTPRGRMTVTEAASAAGISWFAMRNRVMKGWPIEKILSPSQGK